MGPSRRHFYRSVLTAMIVVFVVLLGAAWFVQNGMNHRRYSPFVLAQDKPLDGPDIDALKTLNQAYEQISRSVTPSVVSIQSTEVVKVQQSPLFSDPFFRQFFGNGQPPSQQQEHALGSGVIVTPDGYILTNNHVIKNATAIQVMLSDMRTFSGKVVGADPLTDVAVVRIEGKNLPAASLGDSTTLHVGDIVMAFGNPFGLNFTVTRGAVSALNRSQGNIEGIQNFVQIDAPINPGNSGGALVNVAGEVVGINTAILTGQSEGEGSSEGGFIGIGFAIPIDMAKHVMEDLVKTGKVTRGYLGVAIRDLNPALAKAFHAPDTAGALVQDVTPDGPAAKAGLKNGDVIRKFNGQPVLDTGQLMAVTSEANPGSTVTLDLLRDGKPQTVHVTLGERPANTTVHPGAAAPPVKGALEGVTVQPLSSGVRSQLGIPGNVQGVVITEIDPNSPAAHAGLQQGDVIESINRQPVHSVDDFNRLANQAKAETLLRINRQGTGVFVVISPDGQ